MNNTNNIDDFLNELYENWIDIVIDNVPLVQNFDNNFNRRHFINNGLHIYTNRYNSNNLLNRNRRNAIGNIGEERNYLGSNGNDIFDILHFARNVDQFDENINNERNINLINEFRNLIQNRNQSLFQRNSGERQTREDTVPNVPQSTPQEFPTQEFATQEFATQEFPTQDISNLIGELFGNIFNYMSEPLFEDVKVTVSNEDFDKLEEITITDINIKDYKDKDCNICLEQYELNNNIKILPCKHFFHKNCIKEWLCNEKINCPICRKDIREK